MSAQHLDYKGYIGSAEVDVEGGALVGKLLFIRDTITYSAKTVPELEASFREAVEDYLAACQEDGSEPEFPCKGSFNVRVGPERHRSIVLAARQKGVGLNDFVCAALDDAIRTDFSRTVVHKYEISFNGTTSAGTPLEWIGITAAGQNEAGANAKH